MTAVSPLISTLGSALGVYHGTGQGIESGPFMARIELGRLPNGGISVDYEAVSNTDGVLHREHSMLVGGPDGRDTLTIAHSESPYVSAMVESEPGTGRFIQAIPFGPYAMEVVVQCPEPGRLIYSWWWAEAGTVPTEQSRADVRRLY